MHHHMLYLRKLLFQFVMNPLSDIVGLPQGMVPISGNLNIHINFIAEFAGAQIVDPENSLFVGDAAAELLLGFLVTGMNRQMTRLAMGSMIGNPTLAKAIPISAPIEERASER